MSSGEQLQVCVQALHKSRMRIKGIHIRGESRVQGAVQAVGAMQACLNCDAWID